MELAMTPDRVEVKACCAPMTSLLSRLTRAPVWVRVKNASDICCTCPNTLVRMSKIRPSPIRDENQRVPRDSSASRTASPPITSASRTTTATEPLALISLITSPASSGVATPITDDTTVNSRKTPSSLRYGVANDTTLRSVPAASFLFFTELSWYLIRQVLAPGMPPACRTLVVHHNNARTRSASPSIAPREEWPCLRRPEQACGAGANGHRELRLKPHTHRASTRTARQHRAKP